ncbi:MAG TPA: hypothetical protein VMG08_09845 [Allosphingosinicella sp.]|nr:hypothetical protein [Allosphingosinicella sp.]
MSWLPLALMLLFGLVCLLFARALLAFLLRGMAWQQRHIGAGGTVPFQIRLLSGRGALWGVRILGALLLLGGAIAGIEALNGGRA